MRYSTHKHGHLSDEEKMKLLKEKPKPPAGYKPPPILPVYSGKGGKYE